MQINIGYIYYIVGLVFLNVELKITTTV